MKDTIVLYPTSGMGHLISMVELAKLILTHHPNFSITIIILSPPLDQTTSIIKNSQQIAASTEKYIATVSAAIPSINFHYLPQISFPPNTTLNPVQLEFEIPRLNNPNIHQYLQTQSQTSKIKAFVIDFFCDAAFQVSTDLNIPTYYFFTSAGGSLVLFLHLPSLFHNPKTENNSNEAVLIPGLPPIPCSDLPQPFQDPTTEVYKKFLDTSIHMAKSSGIVVNTFELLESKALRSIWDGHCLPEKQSTPPVFPVGPVISTIAQVDDEHGCLSWLDKQPSKSVVFLSFGSLGRFPANQLMEMAMALENSCHRFLWVVRDPPGADHKKKDLDELLPEGFLERTRERGLVVRHWAPQVAVLSHDSVGGFVTHCGWNSLLEAVCAGVPMVAWPLYAEQRLNRVLLVEEMKLALTINMSEDGLVSAADLEERVRELMESERGREVKERVLLMKDAAAAAMDTDGSSLIALTKLTQLWKQS